MAEIALKKFVITVGVLYGQKHVSFNVHQLCHLAQSVRDWGPLWATSAFPFEGNNKGLLNLFCGTQYVPQQMMKRFQVFQGTKDLAKRCMGNAIPACLDLYLK